MIKPHTRRFDIYLDDIYIRKIEINNSHNWDKSEEAVKKTLELLYPEKHSLLEVERNPTLYQHKYKKVIRTG